MTSAQWSKDLLENNWEENVSLRSDTVPVPQFDYEGQKDRRSSNAMDGDICRVMDGGVRDHQPRSIGYRDEKVVAIVDVEVVTTEGVDRLYGRDDEQYGGLVGEVKRIAHKYRKGLTGSEQVVDPGFDRLEFDSFDDGVSKRGADLYAGTCTLIFTTEALAIGQDSVR